MDRSSESLEYQGKIQVVTAEVHPMILETHVTTPEEGVIERNVYNRDGSFIHYSLSSETTQTTPREENPPSAGTSSDGSQQLERIPNQSKQKKREQKKSIPSTSRENEKTMEQQGITIKLPPTNFEAISQKIIKKQKDRKTHGCGNILMTDQQIEAIAQGSRAYAKQKRKLEEQQSKVEEDRKKLKEKVQKFKKERIAQNKAVKEELVRLKEKREKELEKIDAWIKKCDTGIIQLNGKEGKMYQHVDDIMAKLHEEGDKALEELNEYWESILTRYCYHQCE